MTAAVCPPVPGPELVLPFVAAVRDVCQSMCGVAIETDRPFIKTDRTPTHGVSGIIGFSGHLNGTVVVSFTQRAAEKLAEGFLGVALSINDVDFVDAVGELTNMIAGCAKTKLNTATDITTPSVVIGGYTVSGPSRVPCLVIPCRCEQGEETVELNILQNA